MAWRSFPKLKRKQKSGKWLDNGAGGVESTAEKQLIIGASFFAKCN
jgi:hypothetical protein